jgi:hypothetical protein
MLYALQAGVSIFDGFRASDRESHPAARAATRFIREGRRPCPCGDRQPEPSPSLVASPLEDLKLGAKVRQQCGVRKRKDRKRYDRGDA